MPLPVIVHCAGLTEATLKHVRLLKELNRRGERVADILL